MLFKAKSKKFILLFWFDRVSKSKVVSDFLSSFFFSNQKTKKCYFGLIGFPNGYFGLLFWFGRILILKIVLASPKKNGIRMYDHLR